MGREKSTNLFSFEAKKCPCSLFLPENNGCCNDEHEILTIDDSQSFTAVFAPVTPEFFLIGSTYSDKVISEIIAQPITQYIDLDFSPPPKDPLYKVNCSLVFYDEEVNA